MTWSCRLYWLYHDYTNDTLIILTIFIILLKYIPYYLKSQIILIKHWLYRLYSAYLYQCVCCYMQMPHFIPKNTTHHVIYFKRPFTIIHIICIVLIFLLLFLCRWSETVKMAQWMAGWCWMLMFGHWNGCLRCKGGPYEGYNTVQTWCLQVTKRMVGVYWLYVLYWLYWSYLCKKYNQYKQYNHKYDQNNQNNQNNPKGNVCGDYTDFTVENTIKSIISIIQKKHNQYNQY